MSKCLYETSIDEVRENFILERIFVDTIKKSVNWCYEYEQLEWCAESALSYLKKWFSQFNLIFIYL